MMPSFNISQKPTKVNSILNHVLSLSEGLYTNLQFLESTQISFNSPLLDRQTIALTSLLSSEIEMIRAYSKQPSLFTLFCPLLTKMRHPLWEATPQLSILLVNIFPTALGEGTPHAFCSYTSGDESILLLCFRPPTTAEHQS